MQEFSDLEMRNDTAVCFKNVTNSSHINISEIAAPPRDRDTTLAVVAVAGRHRKQASMLKDDKCL